MNGDFIQAAILAALAQLVKQFPALAPAVILAQLEVWAKDTAAFFEAWQKSATEGPRLELDESGTPTGYYFDSEGNRKHYTQG